jgi:hypothetical protein
MRHSTCFEPPRQENSWTDWPFICASCFGDGGRSSWPLFLHSPSQPQRARLCSRAEKTPAFRETGGLLAPFTEHEKRKRRSPSEAAPFQGCEPAPPSCPHAIEPPKPKNCLKMKTRSKARVAQRHDLCSVRLCSRRLSSLGAGSDPPGLCIFRRCGGWASRCRSRVNRPKLEIEAVG